MHDSLIYGLNLLFLIAIIIWAISSYIEILIYRNIKETFTSISSSFRPADQLSLRTAPDYMIIQGLYKNRKVVCRLNRSNPSQFLHYDLNLRFYIEPLVDQELGIHHNCTATTSAQSLFFTAKIPEQDIVAILEELSHAAEIAESRT
ncbi:MAG: hypothetical protein AUJ74_03780 [Candidatus Omnitrophica bacterium CG1_02_44_16]|nr:MAG: hypothetical protein AUJ74_03780 [Candidatus Omnitrophica bacterium CG1_02_44_16]PIY83319.1 MAG: hypothetical protein COY78_02645 [Candidatus Omnitrophica bacterium CG_4_10_14_0_8_um_filter_44_12]PIZ84547.1 MAG: hypothetical protein COX96_03445 [Candidatus Omnitrophica bacterium CG_4_10_14_0_2_um_filter_44_9]